MKRCPTCDRTYSDETISFCLADGALLSASFDPSREDAPPTEILPTARAPIPPTQPAKAPAPTITSFGARDFAAPEPVREQPPQSSRRMVWIVGACASVALIAGILLVALYGWRNSQSASAVNPPGTITNINNSPTPNANSAITASNSPTPNANSTITASNSPTPVARVSPDKKVDKMTADPVLFPPDSRQTPGTPSPSPPAVDYNRVFSSKEVDSKARILSKPPATYTDAARMNQVTGTITIRAVLAANGAVTNLQALNSLPYGLTEQALAAARRIQFVPAMKDGHSVSMSVQLQYNFNLY